MSLPSPLRKFADVMHEQVRLVRLAAEVQGVDLRDYTDLDVLAILQWAERFTQPPDQPEYTMLGIFVRMREGREVPRDL